MSLFANIASAAKSSFSNLTSKGGVLSHIAGQAKTAVSTALPAATGSLFSDAKTLYQRAAGGTLGGATVGALPKLAGIVSREVLRDAGADAQRAAATVQGAILAGQQGQIGAYAGQQLRGLIPTDIQRYVGIGGEVFSALANGQGLNALSLLGGLPFGSSMSGSPMGGMLIGGIGVDEAIGLYRRGLEARHAYTNLWLINVRSQLGGDMSDVFNLFATDVDRGPSEVAGSKARVGGAQADIVEQGEPVVMRITTLDDEAGTLKAWFEAHASAIAHADGTFGVPGGPEGYAIEFHVQHAFPTENSSAFTGRVLARALSYEVALSRQQQGLEELQMTFTQLDTWL